MSKLPQPAQQQTPKFVESALAENSIFGKEVFVPGSAIPALLGEQKVTGEVGGRLSTVINLQPCGSRHAQPPREINQDNSRTT
jgi:hypothetical protein